MQLVAAVGSFKFATFIYLEKKPPLVLVLKIRPRCHPALDRGDEMCL